MSTTIHSKKYHVLVFLHCSSLIDTQLLLCCLFLSLSMFWPFSGHIDNHLFHWQPPCLSFFQLNLFNTFSMYKLLQPCQSISMKHYSQIKVASLLMLLIPFLCYRSTIIFYVHMKLREWQLSYLSYRTHDLYIFTIKT